MFKRTLVTCAIGALFVTGPLRAQDSIKIMPFGDSITELNWQGGYRSYLYKLLSDSGFTFDFVGRQTKNHDDNSLGFDFPQPYWDHEGYTGRAIFPTWLDHVDTALAANPPRVVLLLLGTNDVANGTRSALQIRNHMSALLDSIWTFDPAIRIVVSNLPRVVPGSLFSQKKLDSTMNVNALWPGLVREKRQSGRYLILIDNFSALSDASDFDSDGVHPSVAGYKKMRYVWYPAVVAAIRNRSVVDIPVVTSPANGASNVPVNTNLQWVAEPGAVSYRVQVAANALFNPLTTEQGGITGTSFAVNGLASGTKYYWRVRATGDSSESAYSWMRSFTTAGTLVDTTAPTVALTAPANGDTVSNVVLITANASDNIGVAGVRFAVDGNDLGPDDLTAPYSYSWNTAPASAGPHTITVTARDTAGNVSLPAAVTVVVDLSAPPPVDSVRIMPLGDSITELDWQGGYRSYLYKLLSDSGFVFDYVGRRTLNHNDASIGFAFPAPYWDHEGYTGRAIYPTWLDDIGAAMKANVPDIALVMLGTNDAANGTRSSSQIRDYMSALLDSLWAYNPAMKVVLSTMPRQVPGTLFNQKTLDTIVAANALWPALVQSKAGAGRSIVLVDNYAALTETSDFTGDGIHPSPAGYRKMRYVWYPAVAAALTPTTGVRSREAVPSEFALEQNYPNPFNPVTTIRFTLRTGGFITLDVRDVLGRAVRTLVTGTFPAGEHRALFDASGLSSGVYVYTLRSGDATLSRTMLLLR